MGFNWQYKQGATLSKKTMGFNWLVVVVLVVVVVVVVVGSHPEKERVESTIGPPGERNMGFNKRQDASNHQ